MTELERLAELREQLTPELNEAHVERLVRGGAARRERSRRLRALQLGLGAGILATAAVGLGLHELSVRTPRAAPVTHAPGAPLSSAARIAPSDRAPALVLADGSSATPLERGTELSLLEDSASRAELSLSRGRAHFEVTHNEQRSFLLRAGAVTVRVTGTVFDVEVVADRVGVSVERGAVLVDWGVASGQLSAGEKGWFPPLLVPTPAFAASARAQRPSAASSAGAARAVLAVEAPSEPRPSVQELFKEVDQARAHGQSEHAVELLRQILRERGSDARAPLAAMTLGRMLLTELGRPREAAAAFAQVRARDAAGPFVEDALAREVEAWAQAGEHERAKALARSYLARYGEGRFADRVRAVAGL
ncbi:MAG TPA: FecR family protein [Polyangiaceae bacterium]|jgi:transmembrane sensor